MAKKAFEKIMAGLEDAVAYADGDRSRGVVHRVKNKDVDRVSDRVYLFFIYPFS